jgi:hypothetical protein
MQNATTTQPGRTELTLALGIANLLLQIPDGYITAAKMLEDFLGWKKITVEVGPELQFILRKAYMAAYDEDVEAMHEYLLEAKTLAQA